MTLEEKTILELEALGLTVTESNIVIIRSRLERVTAFVKNFCNREDIPEGLEPAVADMAAGETLLQMASFGLLPQGFDVNQALKSIRLGDTDVTFADSEAVNFDAAVSRMRDGAKAELYRYRKMRWHG